MSRTNALLRVLRICSLVLLSTGRPGSISAGTTAVQSPAFTCDGVSEIPREECEVLVALYNSTNGPGWSHDDGWLTNGTPCSWYGVTCVYFGQWVGGLDLGNNQLSGALPHSLMNLHLINFLHYSNTHLCEPTDAAFQAWLESVISLQRTGVSCEYAYLPFCAR